MTLDKSVKKTNNKKAKLQELATLDAFNSPNDETSSPIVPIKLNQPL